MTDHHFGFHAPFHPEHRQSIFNNEECRLSKSGLLQLLCCCFLLVLRWIQDVSQVQTDMVFEILCAKINLFAECWFGLIEIFSHIDILSTLTWEEESNRTTARGLSIWLRQAWIAHLHNALQA